MNTSGNRSRLRSVQLKRHDIETSMLEAVISRGDRRVADAIELAWKRGARMDSWNEQLDADRWWQAFADCGVDADQVLHQPLRPGRPPAMGPREREIRPDLPGEGAEPQRGSTASHGRKSGLFGVMESADTALTLGGSRRRDATDRRGVDFLTSAEQTASRVVDTVVSYAYTRKVYADT